MNYAFHPLAKAELAEAADYYEECRPGLGDEFLKEIYSAIQRIILFPNAWSGLSENTRRCLVNRFPYGVIYRIVEDEILIVAVTQLNRKPRDFRTRLEK
jgi:plasmid stabilization system protein ParE